MQQVVLIPLQVTRSVDVRPLHVMTEVPHVASNMRPLEILKTRREQRRVAAMLQQPRGHLALASARKAPPDEEIHLKPFTACRQHGPCRKTLLEPVKPHHNAHQDHQFHKKPKRSTLLDMVNDEVSGHTSVVCPRSWDWSRPGAHDDYPENGTAVQVYDLESFSLRTSPSRGSISSIISEMVVGSRSKSSSTSQNDLTNSRGSASERYILKTPPNSRNSKSSGNYFRLDVSRESMGEDGQLVRISNGLRWSMGEDGQWVRIEDVSKDKSSTQQCEKTNSSGIESAKKTVHFEYHHHQAVLPPILCDRNPDENEKLLTSYTDMLEHIGIVDSIDKSRPSSSSSSVSNISSLQRQYCQTESSLTPEQEGTLFKRPGSRHRHLESTGQTNGLTSEHDVERNSNETATVSDVSNRLRTTTSLPVPEISLVEPVVVRAPPHWDFSVTTRAFVFSYLPLLPAIERDSDATTARRKKRKN